MRPSFLEGLVTSLRPWSFSAALSPLLVALAVLRCQLRLEFPGYCLIFFLVVAVLSVQAMANLVNSYVDYERGVDRKETAGDRTLVDCLISVGTLKLLAVVALLLWSSFFVWSVVASGFNVLLLSLALSGTLLAVGYTAGPAPLKYLGLGDLTVWLCFGPCLIAYASVVLVGAVHWQALAFTAPLALLVVATLHANNYRDIEADVIAGARTVASRLGPAASLHYYSFLLFTAHAGVLLVGVFTGCLGAATTLLVAPQSLYLCYRIRRAQFVKTQDEETAKTTMMFGAALALGIATMPGMEVSKHGFGAAALVVTVLKLCAD